MQIDTLAFIAVALVAVAAAVLSIVGWLRAGSSSSVPALMEGKIDSELRHTREQSQLVVNVLDRRLVEMAGKVGDLERGLANFRMSTVKELNDVRVAQERGHAAMQTAIGNTLRGVQDSVSQQLVAIRDDNNRNLEQIRSTVDEKLQKTLNDRINDSFRLVNEQLDSVSKGLGEMRGMAQSVGDLRKVLSNVKTRGIVGEVQLAAILKEVLSPEQYETNVATVPDSLNRVEFAVRIPGKGDEFVYLPIDAKFPAEAYGHLEDAKDAGDDVAIRAAWKELETRLKNEAKDIHEKYVAPPATTPFAVLFLPFEGLYAEVVNRTGLVERIQREWHVSVAGPSTMAALLNALQMGFQTVAIQKRADEIQKVLAAVKAELPKYRMELEKAQRQLNTASKTIDGLVGRRTRAMERTLSGVTATASLGEADELLGIEVQGAALRP
ncbi:recombinase RmuC [Olsenella sp. oral taxon 807]|jgi:rmuC domain protein|uniref:DNA recombination protein RmuC n=1 Tax=Olsenella sp. oral taxon 807 TaxID=712411 RepID=UPI00067A2033|nr:DNA recombination protein RmuC [Olsenella sp. oral taxon 807]AKT49531.1 recombinase RmuC [Olsenella sp. oral taxon 807]